MVRDRMPELLACQTNSTAFGKRFIQDVHIQISQNKKLKQVLDEVEEIRGLIRLISENTAIVKDLYNNVLSHTNKDIQKELEVRTYSISQTSFRIQQKLRELGKDITAHDSSNLSNVIDGPAHLRIKALQYTTMIRLFSNIMEEYNMCMLRYHAKCRSLLQQQKTLIRKQITSEELDNLLESRENGLFIDNILEDTRIAKQQLADIQSRHKDIMKLEKSITEVRDMFTEMAFLVDKQSEQLNSVEYFAGRTASNVVSGRIDLKKSEKRSRRYRRRKLKICLVISIIIIILLLVFILCN
ncbi:syntaxin-1A [Lasioglossum baleicum]|uniref:syntaxin-1A n=1 Tax=Lasioglossum baleicum TaxID=434251 RepID=UPI003FCC5BF9